MKFADTDFAPYDLTLPRAQPIPFVCDSPHSGSVYPADFRSVLPLTKLRWAEDTLVDALWSGVPDAGGTLLAANFPRTYIDLNREPDDLDPTLLAEPWAEPLSPSERCRQGCGLIWSRIRGEPVYDHKLWAAEVLDRIERYYKPYYQVLADRMQALESQFGVVWHINVHSMPSDTGVLLGRGAAPLADVVLGDLHGKSCDPTFTGIVEDYLRDRGYTVARNDPFAGMALVRRFGRPAHHWHSLQIEVSRGLYLDEHTSEKSAGFARVQHDMSGLAGHIARFVTSLL
ncbi:MAG: N-formylglutamate amidohydrolase [Burkholderiaceae bacterium]